LAANKTADDPAGFIFGVRPMGMGNAFSALADDINALFVNPAGLASLNHVQATSFSGKFLNEVNYFSFAAAFPTLRGTFGVGYIGSDFGFTAFDTYVSGGQITTSTEAVSFSDNDSTWLLSYSTAFNKTFSFGAALKLFTKKLATTTAAGRELDLGILFKPRPNFSAGLTAKNLLPEGMGGKLEWSGGTIEDLPTLFKGGISLKIIGHDGFYKRGNEKLLFNIDADYYPNLSNVPLAFHTGLEWSPLRFLDLRLGFDQSSLTAGIGLKRGKFRFDYTYNQFASFPDAGNNFFAINYGLFEEEDYEAQEAKLAQEKKEREARELAEKERKEKENRLREQQRELERAQREIRAKEAREAKLRQEAESKKLEEEKKKQDQEKSLKEREERSIKQREEGERAAKNREQFFKGIGGAFGAMGQGIGSVFGNAGQGIGSAFGAAGNNVGKAWNDLLAERPREKEKEKEKEKKTEKVKEAPEKVEPPLPPQQEVVEIQQSFEELQKVFSGEKPLSELGRIAPQIATSFLVLALKLIIFPIVLLVIFVLFKEWDRRTQ